jgi:hypothetical protein
MAVLPFGKSTTNKNKFKQRMTKRSYAVHFSLRTYSLDARSRGGNVEIPDMKTAYAGHYYIIIPYYNYLFTI